MGFWLIEARSAKLVMNIMRQQLKLNRCITFHCVSKSQVFRPGLRTFIATISRQFAYMQLS